MTTFLGGSTLRSSSQQDRPTRNWSSSLTPQMFQTGSLSDRPAASEISFTKVELSNLILQSDDQQLHPKLFINYAAAAD